MTQCVCLHLQLLGEVADADDTDFELVAWQIPGRFNQIADALAFNMAPDKKNLELTVYRVRHGALRGVPTLVAMRTKR